VLEQLADLAYKIEQFFEVLSESEFKTAVYLAETTPDYSGSRCLPVEAVIDSLAALEFMDMVNVKYHTDLFGADKLDQSIHSVANVRNVYYGVPSVPYSEMDGGFSGATKYDYVNRSLSSEDIEMRSLQDPGFKINLQTSNNANIINIHTNISSLSALNNREITLHVAVLKMDTTVTGTKFKNVALALLPDPAGITFQQNWLPGDSKTFSTTYNVNSVKDTSKILIVAFVQDEVSKEIIQVAVNKRPSLSTGMIPVIGQNQDKVHFNVFPNPAQKNVYLVFDDVQPEHGLIEIYNQMGILMQTVTVETGNTRYYVDVSGYTGGLYLISFFSNNR